MENDKIFSKTIQTRIDKKLMGEKVRDDSGDGKRSLYYLYYCFFIINNSELHTTRQNDIIHNLYIEMFFGN